MDCGIQLTDHAGTTSVSGLDWLEGETVVVYADGQYIGEKVVSSGIVSLGDTYYDIHIGLDYESKITELPEPVDTPDGSALSRTKSKPKVDVRLFRTQGVKVNGDIRNLPREASTDKPELFSGIIETSKLGWDYDAQNSIESIGPLPLTVLFIRSTLNVGNE
jgi:hypothetical protein